jgi:hypothetical protein
MEVEENQVGVTDLSQFEPFLSLALTFKRFLVRFGRVQNVLP